MSEEKKTEEKKDPTEVPAVNSPEGKPVEKVEIPVGEKKDESEAVTAAMKKVTSLVEEIISKANANVPPAATPAAAPDPATEPAKPEEGKKPEAPVVEAKKADEKPPEIKEEKNPEAKDASLIASEIALVVQKEVAKTSSQIVEITNAIKELLGALKACRDESKGLEGRVEKMEKVYQPSKSVEDDGGTDTQVDNVKKNFWSGVL